MKNWIKVGLGWVLFMFVSMVFVFPFFGREEITLKSILLGIVICSLGGIIFGYSMRKNFKKIKPYSTKFQK